ncbi:hypothetical protein M3591_13490 [Exiguobacterium sp. MER 193]|uniref:hypothetical protein n=1 Tax=Exiguobacterium sp. MER 193 TaxID=2939564 RepID=UPI0020420A81|nr:hypothetical protein [Exiguobacterium sp. MER 193]MCM3281514.1 hypothetical protein [Exiguobacterium sp. MER 193]
MSQVSESQKRAIAKWEAQNKEKKKYISHRARARSFLRDVATMDDLEEFKQVIADREHSLSKEENLDSN